MTPYTLYLVIPCYNEAAVLPITAPLFIEKIAALQTAGRVSEASRVLFVDDGSGDDTWAIITALAAEHPAEGVRLTRNRGHQNALLAGLMTAKEKADVAVSLDCDGQDDIHALDRMLDEYEAGCDIVYGVRADRSADSTLKRRSARGFYRLSRLMGVETVYDHADYRLMSRRALEGLAQFKEVNLYLRGLVPLVGYRTATVAYHRAPRAAGKSRYPLGRMLHLAADGITSLSTRPLKMITALGLGVFFISLVMIVWCLIRHFTDNTVSGWASQMCVTLFLGGVQLLCVGVLGEYIGKIYAEVKGRPRYLVQDTTFEEGEQ